mmetsp:Transcript_53132/g.108355  ORF Transcript_53132/g.108355 Transcript_53132/m.108355 type:complete len:211 (-) Transcript_53132:549-1181(-)
MSDIVDGLLVGGHVRPQHLPVVPCPLQLDFALKVDGEQIRDPRAPSEQRRPGAGAEEELVHDGALAVDHVHVLDRHPARVHHAHVLLHHNRHLVVDLEDGAVAHVEGAHQLKHGDFEGEIEGRHDRPPAVRPAVPVGHLARVVSRHSERLDQEANLVAGEVFEELAGNDDLALSLRVALGRYTLDQPSEEVLHSGIRHHLSSFRGYLTVV